MFTIRNSHSVRLVQVFGVFAAALVALLWASGSAVAGEPGWGRGYHDSPHHGGGHGSVSFGWSPAPVRWVTPAPVYVAPAPVIVTPVVPAPEIITLSDGTIIQRSYTVCNGVVVSRDTVIQTAPVIVQPAPVIVQPSTPTWVNIVRGIGVSVRW